MTSPLALVLAGLLQAGVADNTAVESGAPALVVVTLPANASPAILEALNRLRGEAISEGFEVRLVDPANAPATSGDGVWAGLRPAAVVGFGRPNDAHAPHALDVTFLNRSRGKTAIAHLTADDIADEPERADVIIAVRAVDFIRARMFDTLADRRGEPVPSATPTSAPIRRFYVAAGIVLLGTPAGFAPAFAPRLAAGYRPAGWLRVGATAFGLGSEPYRESTAGRVGLDQRFVGAEVTLLGRVWHRFQPMLEVGGGEYWVAVRGEATAPNVGRTFTLTSPGAAMSVALALDILPALALELRGGALWLQSQVQVRVQGTDDTYLGSLGRPIWFGGVALAATF